MAYFQQHAPYHHQQQQQRHPMMQGNGYPQHHSSPYHQQSYGHPPPDQYHHHQQQQHHQHQHQYNQHHQYGGHHHHQQQHQQQYYPPMMETEEDRLEAAAANELLDADSKHENMLSIDFLPCPNTVIVGRGRKVAQHAGNVRFRELVKKELTEYSAATTKAHKSSIIQRVLTEVRLRSHHAFVKQNLTTQRWYRVEENAQRITTAQAFRDALKDNYKSSRAHKKYKREEEKKEGGEKVKGKKKGKGKKEQSDGKDNSPSSSPKRKSTTSSNIKSKVAARGKALSPIPQEPMQDSPMKDEPEAPKSHQPLSCSDKKKPTMPMALDDGEKKDAKKKPPKDSQAAMDKMRAMLEAQQSDLTAGNFTWWKPEAVQAVAQPQVVKMMPPPASKKSSRGSGGDDAIPSASVASCSSLLWSNHSKFSERGSRPRKEREFNFNMSGHSIKNLSNHSIMTISGHSTRSNSTFNGLMAKIAPAGDASNPFEPRPIAAAVQEHEDGVAMDIEMDDVFTSTADMEASSNSHFRTQPYTAKSSTTFDEGIAMGLGNLSDHSLMSNMSSIHSVKGFTPEEIFVESNHTAKDRSNHRGYHGGSRYRGGYGVAMS
ncbi:Nitrilase family, member 2 [Seminavis robusta]|uniref:Nitrilase family, member 2 n=1 Tax=Seminavis robusta TaxID=568900 RepID=A0A9N8DQM5_9STRA|nr:Nitrilase family, member 2 [Seminavis robusta]|eukprot:Sro278_g106520.1 Nitrilase family, member 2 (599) ;mRNA; r:20566-22362